MTVRSMPSKPKDYHAKSGLVYHCRSTLEWHFCGYLDRFYPAQQWAYEPEHLRGGNGRPGYICDIRVLTDPVVWVEIKYAGFLDTDHKELRDTVAKLDRLRQAHPRDRVALVPWHHDWTSPQGPWLLNTRTGWHRIDGREASPWQVSA